MPFYLFFWTPHREAKLREHGVSVEDFEAIVQDPEEVERSRSSGRLIAFGDDSEGRYLACVYLLDDDEMTIFPITAYPIED